MGCAVALLLAGGLFLGSYRSAPQNGAAPANGMGEDALSVTSVARNVGGANAQGTGSELSQQGRAAAEKQKELAAQQQQQAAAQAAAQEAALAEKQRELAQQAANQAALEKQLEQDRARVEAEKQKADAAAAEAQRQRAAAAAEAERLKQQAAQNQARPAIYSGPSSGNIVWQGEVQGTTLVTINGNASDTGQVLSGGLPGVLVMVQPADSKHVGVAGAPAPSNAYHRLTLRIQGHGVMQEVIHWSVP